MTAEYIIPAEIHPHLHLEISAEDREYAVEISKQLGPAVVRAMIDSLEEAIASNPEDPFIADKRYELEVWYQSGILALDNQ